MSFNLLQRSTSKGESETETGSPCSVVRGELSESGIGIVGCNFGFPIEILRQNFVVSRAHSGSVRSGILGSPCFGVGDVANIEVDVHAGGAESQRVFHVEVGPSGKGQAAEAGSVIGVHINIVQREALSQRLSGASKTNNSYRQSEWEGIGTV